MGKKAKEFKSGDFIFAKVKGYPAWPARVQKLNGKKYFVYFYGTGETANLPGNMIFDYVENKDKFLTKSVKRRDFNDGVKQIEHDFANNVPLEDVIGANPEAPPPDANDTANDSAINDTMDTTAETSIADDTLNDTTTNTTQNDVPVEDSDETGALIIDEGKAKAKKAKPDPKTPATPKPKTPRGRAKKDETPKEDTKEAEEDEKKDEELVSRSGRKIRPKRYIDEQTEENTTLPSPATKKKRVTSPPPQETEVEKEPAKEKEKNVKHYNAVSQSELEDLKEPFKPADAEKDNILIAYLPTGQYIGVKLFQSRPTSYKNNAARLQWDKQAAANAVTLKLQLEKGHISPQSISAQLVMDLNLTDEEKAALDKERETEEKRSRVQFLKTEMKLIELEVKIKTCLCLDKADTESCLKLLDELTELDIKPLMLLKHPTCVETIKRMRAYVGNTPSWELSETDTIAFSKRAHHIRKRADDLYTNIKNLFTTPEGLAFWEFFSERVQQFKKATASLNADELLELVHEPLEMTQPTAHTTKAVTDAVNEEVPPLEEDVEVEKKKKNAPAKNKKVAANSTSKTPAKRQSSRKQQEKEEKEKPKEMESEKEIEKPEEESTKSDNNADKPAEEQSEANEENNKVNNKEGQKDSEPEKEAPKEQEKENGVTEEEKIPEDKTNDIEMVESSEKSEDKSTKEVENTKESKQNDKKDAEEEKKEKEKEKEKEVDEPRAKRSRGENKKTEAPPPKSPAKRKSKA